MWSWLCANPAMFRKQIWVLEAVVGTQPGSWVCGTWSSRTRPWAWAASGALWWESLGCQGHEECFWCGSGATGRVSKMLPWSKQTLSSYLGGDTHPHPPSINRMPQVSIWASHRKTSAVVWSIWSPPSLLLVGIWWCICLHCVLWFWILNKIPWCSYHQTSSLSLLRVEVVIVVVVVLVFIFQKW